MPMLGGLTCSLLSTLDSRILFFGYDTLNTLLAESSGGLGLLELVRLIFLKAAATSVARGTNLVGGGEDERSEGADYEKISNSMRKCFCSSGTVTFFRGRGREHLGLRGRRRRGRRGERGSLRIGGSS